MGFVLSKIKKQHINSQIISPQESKDVKTRDLLNGECETQVSEGGEADLHKHLVGCPKNPGHTKFIPVKTFRVQDLPEGLQCVELYQYIKAVADLTVRVDVKMTSPNRPEFYPDTNIMYPYYNMRNKSTFRLGSGEVSVYKFIDGLGCDAGGKEKDVNGNDYESKFSNSTKTCPCTKCQHSDRSSYVWWEIFIVTSAHVVFDDIEASHTSCRLFYDELDSPVVSLDKINVHFMSIDGDLVLLKCVTCDSLGDKLYNLQAHTFYLMLEIKKMFKNRSDTKFSFIVSHPHGCHKQVSLGYLTSIHKVKQYTQNIDFTKMTYTTCTCPGSSGARVYSLYSGGHIHSGSLSDGCNYSSTGLYIK